MKIFEIWKIFFTLIEYRWIVLWFTWHYDNSNVIICNNGLFGLGFHNWYKRRGKVFIVFIRFIIEQNIKMNWLKNLQSEYCNGPCIS